MIRQLSAALILAGTLWAQPAPPSTAAEIAVVREINKIRRFPKEYAKYLRSLGLRFEGTLWRLADRIPIRTHEGRAAVLEAADFLDSVEPVQELIAYNEGLHLAARDHVRDQGPTGETGHAGTDGSTVKQRILRYCAHDEEHDSLVGEVINYGDETPRMTVIQLVIDDGVPGRGHRHNIFNREFQQGGAAIGFHKEYGTMVVVDLGDAFMLPKRP